ncbi:MAG: hypothetical protein COA36_15105 [Desulfotalea sp.]|nr:MAG: hypothetical protein COA36_15105 [Desulfotalea sp.]
MNKGTRHITTSHTTVGLTLDAGYDPKVKKEPREDLGKTVPLLWHPHAEGNSPAQVMPLLAGGPCSLFRKNKQLQPGTMQAISPCKYNGPRLRTAHWKFIPDQYNS